MTTGIQWTDETWNPVVGCTKVSQGCKHCYAKTVHDNRHKANVNYALFAVDDERHQGDGEYALKIARRLGMNVPLPAQYDQPFETVQLMPERLTMPLHWRRHRKVFVNSVSDLFHEDVPFEFIDQVFAVMALCPQHTFQVLTKRPERMRDYLGDPKRYGNVRRLVDDGPLAVAHRLAMTASALYADNRRWWTHLPVEKWPLPNVWLGTSVEDQNAADRRIPELLATPSAVRFLSCEPLLGPVDIRQYLFEAAVRVHDEEGWGGDLAELVALLHWVIVGGESGGGARPCDIAWIRSLRDQCRAAGVPVFVKQVGAKPRTHFLDHRDAPYGNDWPVDLAFAGKDVNPPLASHHVEADWWKPVLRDRHGGDPAEWPEDLRVREFPEPQP